MLRNVGKATLILQVLKPTWRGSVDERNGEKPSFIFAKYWVQKEDMVEGSSVNEQRWKCLLWTLRSYRNVRFHTFLFLRGIWGSPQCLKCTVLVKTHWRTSLAVQWVRHHPPTEEVWSLVGQLRSHMPCSRAKKVKNKTRTAKASYEIKECGHTLHTHPSLYT